MSSPLPSAIRQPFALPPVSNLDVQTLPFIGRDDEIHELQTLIDEHATVLLHDLPGYSYGYGKTQMAIAYVLRYTLRYDVAWWFRCEQETDEDQLQVLVDQEIIKLRQACAAADPVIPCGDHLESGERWLLIFDGVHDPERIRPFFPQGSGHVLVISRRQGAAWGQGTLALGGLSPRQSHALLASQLEKFHHNQLKRLAETMDGHPARLLEVANLIKSGEVSYPVCIRLLSMRPRSPGQVQAAAEASPAVSANGVGARVPGQAPARGERSGSPLSADGRRTLVAALHDSAPGKTREAYDVWIESIRERIRPEKLPVIPDSSAVTTRLSALITAALAAPTPELLKALFEMAVELSPGSEGLERARPLVDRAAASWNADANGRRHDA